MRLREVCTDEIQKSVYSACVCFSTNIIMCARAPSRLETTCWAGAGTASTPRRSGTRAPISPSNDRRVCMCIATGSSSTN